MSAGKPQWLGLCSNVRRTSEGEGKRQEMMEARAPISMEAFATIIDHEDFTCRFGITLDEALRQDQSSYAFVSRWGRDLCIFFQSVGFEFIWLIYPKRHVKD